MILELRVSCGKLGNPVNFSENIRNMHCKAAFNQQELVKFLRPLESEVLTFLLAVWGVTSINLERFEEKYYKPKIESESEFEVEEPDCEYVRGTLR